MLLTYTSAEKVEKNMAAHRTASASTRSRVLTNAALGIAAVGALAAATIASATASSADVVPDPLTSAAAQLDTSGKWAPAALATIHPGVMTTTKGSGQCTANFLYTDAAKRVYLGQAAHCSGTGEATQTNGCEAGSLPLGTPVTIGASGVTGKLAYNSWLLMQKVGEKNEDACANNDLALIEIPADAIAKINPSIPVFGGPTGLNTTGTSAGESVYSYGNSSLRQGIATLSPKYGTSLGDAGNGWSHTVYTATPGIPGDSGSAFLDAKGNALGDLSTLSLAPQPLSNQVSDLHRELAYAEAHSALKGLRVVAGTEPFLATALPF